MPKFNKDYSSREEYERAKQIHMESIIEKITNPEIIDRESTVEEIAEILKNNKIDQIIIAGEKQKNKEEQTLRLHPDLDSELALYLLNNFNKRKPEEMYNDGAIVSVINKNGTGKELIEDKKGVKIYLDTGGNWLKIEKDGETTTLYIDHHGTGQREPTSGVKMTAEIMEKAGILKEKPEWLNKLIDFVNDVDNLTYLDKKEKEDDKIFTESYFRNEWPASLYALAEKKIPLKLLIELCEKGIIKDLTKPFTDEELNGEIGKIKIGEQTIKDLCLEQRKEMSTTLDVGIKNSIQHNKKEGINLEKTRLGKIIYQDYFKIKGKVNIIPDHLAFKATIAKGYDTYIAFNKQKDIFFINSKNPNLSNVVEELNKKYPGCATDIRGVMVYGKIVDGLNEEEFLNIIDPKILKEKNKVSKKEKENTEGSVANSDVSEPEIIPEENKIENLVSQKEWTDFVERTTITEHTISNIAEKIKNGKKLSEKEEAIREYDELQKATGVANRAFTQAVYKKLEVLYSDSNVYRDIPIKEIEKTQFYKDNSDLIAQKLTNWDLTIDKVKSVVLHPLYHEGKGWIQFDIKEKEGEYILLAQIDLSLDENLHSLGKETEKASKELDDYVKNIKKGLKEKTPGENSIDNGNKKNLEDLNEKEKQEKIDAILEQFMQSISKTKELEKRLAEIVEQENIAIKKKKEEENPDLHKESDETKENKIEGNYTTIGYADVILDGKLKTKYISSEPREDTVFEILKDENGNIKLGIWKGAEKRALKNPDFLDGTEKMKINNKPTQINVELGDLQKDDEGGYRLIKNRW